MQSWSVRMWVVLRLYSLLCFRVVITCGLFETSCSPNKSEGNLCFLKYDITCMYKCKHITVVEACLPVTLHNINCSLACVSVHIHHV